ncbi:hypothetical protein RALTA_A0838 [Cupriavidus taiwanensis LMG 19424]|uniref:Uncharacterized protein n=1 Tax=Cupriavidus taiwanensis (strain DSM 17343 / BCRC 17206 / CCUG 44338 / CIP 107171 / LMG 19424 / R1) TaxID=977880 RepID=B3R3C7_CUPTR|nr:hypothetical protein RALTA_A0838 [Cupriavidus taiwanensis LMG 19424]
MAKTFSPNSLRSCCNSAYAAICLSTVYFCISKSSGQSTLAFARILSRISVGIVDIITPCEECMYYLDAIGVPVHWYSIVTIQRLQPLLEELIHFFVAPPNGSASL